MSNIFYVYLEPIVQSESHPPYFWKAVSMNGDSYMKSAEGYSVHDAIKALYRKTHLLGVLVVPHRIVNFKELPEWQQNYLIDRSHENAKQMERFTKKNELVS